MTALLSFCSVVDTNSRGSLNRAAADLVTHRSSRSSLRTRLLRLGLWNLELCPSASRVYPLSEDSLLSSDSRGVRMGKTLFREPDYHFELLYMADYVVGKKIQKQSFRKRYTLVFFFGYLAKISFTWRAAGGCVVEDLGSPPQPEPSTCERRTLPQNRTHHRLLP